jgi:hypothetical protein
VKDYAISDALPIGIQAVRHRHMQTSNVDIWYVERTSTLDSATKLELDVQIQKYEKVFQTAANTLCSGKTLCDLQSPRHVTTMALLLHFFLQSWGHAMNPDHRTTLAEVSTGMMAVWNQHYLGPLGGNSGGRKMYYSVSGEVLRDLMLLLGYKCRTPTFGCA